MRLNIFKRSPKLNDNLPLFDEAFLRRLERLSFRTMPTLRGSLKGDRRSRNLRPALDFSDHRPYAPGDDLRHVDWHAFGRHDDLFVKLGEATQSVNIHILLDCSRSMAWTSPRANGQQINKWNSARRLAGTLGYLGLASGERVVITPFPGELDQAFGPTEGKRQVISALQFLSAVAPVATVGEGQGELVRNVAAYARRYPRGGLLVLISDLLDTVAPSETFEIVDEVADLAEALSHLPPPRWQVLVMHLLAEDEMDPSFKGEYDLQDIETTHSLPFRLNEDTLSRYRSRVNHWCAAVQSACLGRGATYSRIMVEWPLERKVVPYLRQRGVVQ